MQESRSVAQLIFDVARNKPETPILITAGGVVEYGQVAEMAARFAYHMHGLGVDAGSCVSITSKDTATLLATVIATSLLGCTWAYDTSALRKTKGIEVSHRFTTDVSEGSVPEDVTLIDESWLEPVRQETRQSVRLAGFRDPNLPWLIFPSSGTTGTPKFMSLSENMFLRRVEAVREDFCDPNLRAVFLFAIHSPPSLFRALAILIHGGALVESVERAFWEETGVTDVLGSPLQIRETIGTFIPNEPFAKAWIGGAQLPDQLAHRALGVFKTVVNTYGSGEANMVLENEVRLKEGHLNWTTIWRDSEVEIVDENHQPCPSGVEGQGNRLNK